MDVFFLFGHGAARRLGASQIENVAPSSYAGYLHARNPTVEEKKGVFYKIVM